MIPTSLQPGIFKVDDLIIFYEVNPTLYERWIEEEKMKKWFRMVQTKNVKGSQNCDPFALFLKKLKKIFIE